MADTSVGNQLANEVQSRPFRLRLRLPLTKIMVLGLLPLLLFSHNRYGEDGILDTLLGSLGLSLLVLAAAGRIWASLYLAGRKDRELVVDGPYSIVRNPLYLFSFVGFLGAGLAFESLTLAALLATIFAVAHWPAIRQEEARLAVLFGERYRRYCREVPAFIPCLRRTAAPEAVSVNTNLFCLALREAALIPMVVIVADMLEWAKLSGILPVLLFVN